jgi:hypothetical protein
MGPLDGLHPVRSHAATSTQDQIWGVGQGLLVGFGLVLSNWMLFMACQLRVKPKIMEG